MILWNTPLTIPLQTCYIPSHLHGTIIEIILEHGKKVQIIDLPGTYSLIPTSLDESITRKAILGQKHEDTAGPIENPLGQ